MEKEIIAHLEAQGCDILWDINTHEQEWYDFRDEFEGSGGSSIGTILGINKWQSAFESFHYDAKLVDKPDIGNEPMFWGTTLEPVIADIWTFIDPTDIKSYIKRKKPIRKLYDLNKYVLNSKYPRLYSSPDRIIPIGEKKYKEVNGVIEEDGILEIPGILEIKKLSSYAIKEYGGFPEYYIAQVQEYMLICGIEYGELIGLIDGSKIIMQIVHADKDYHKLMVDKTNDYWDRVVAVKSMITKVDELRDQAEELPGLKANPLLEEAGELMVAIEDYFPPVDNSESLAIFMNKNYNQVAHEEQLPSTVADRTYARRWKLLVAVKKKIEGEIQFVKNNLEAKLFNKGFSTLSLGDDKGSIRLYARGKATTPSLYDSGTKVGDEKESADVIIQNMNIYEFDLEE